MPPQPIDPQPIDPQPISSPRDWPQRNWPQRNWEVLLIGGASGSGKTSISYRIAQHFGTGITEADDIHVAVMSMTTPEQQPILFRWEVDPAARQWPAERILSHFLDVCAQMSAAYAAVIANHLESRVPLVLEGDYLLPALAAQTAFNGIPNQGRVRGIFIHETDEEQFVQNYLLREPDSGRQEGRARVSWLHSQWLVQEVARVGGTVVQARPWATLFERILASLEEA